MASDPLYPEISFPFLGVDLTEESADQKPGTAEVGENCRSLDPRSRRTRGASRSGLSKYLPPQVDGTATLVQHLQPIVDPTTAAMHVSYPPIPPRPPTLLNGGGPDEIPERPPDDPPLSPNPPYPPDEVISTPNEDVTVPAGGGGTDLGPGPDDEDPGGGGGGWVFRQSVINSPATGVPAGGGVVEMNFAFASDVEDNQLLVLGVTAFDGEYDDGTDSGTYTLTGATVADSLGNTWTEIASETAEQLRPADPPFFSPGRYHIKLFYTRTNGGTCSVTVSLAYSNSVGIPLALSPIAIGAEYTGLENASPFEGAAGDNFSGYPGPDGPVTLTAGACPVGGNTRLAVGFMRLSAIYGSGGPEGTVSDGFTLRRQSASFTATNGSWVVWIDDTSTGVASEPSVVSPSFETDAGDETHYVIWLAANAAFRFGV